jgi:hypothetical protein
MLIHFLIQKLRNVRRNICNLEIGFVCGIAIMYCLQRKDYLEISQLSIVLYYKTRREIFLIIKINILPEEIPLTL